MADTTFTAGTVIASSWLNDINDNVYDAVGGTTGTSNRTIQEKFRESISVKDFGAMGDGVTDDRAACQAAIDFMVAAGGGDIIFPSGTYLLTGVAGGDSTNNGLLIPFSGFTIDTRIRLIGEGNAILKANSNNMFVVRVCQPGCELIGLTIHGGWNIGAGFTSNIGIGLVAADRTQTTTLVSQSFCKIIRCHVTQCDEGLILEPGPTVTGAQSGAFYPVIEACDFNFNARSMWFKVSPHDATNRPTRGNIAFCRIERGNCGIDLDYATEFTLIGNNFQFFNTTYNQATIPTVPYTDSRAIHVGTSSEFNNVYGGEAEACTYDIYNDATLPNALFLSGFSLGGTNFNAGVLGSVERARHRVVRSVAGNEQLEYVFGNSSGARLVYDYDVDGSKTLVVETNGVQRARWFNGVFTHYGSTGNTTLDATGQLNVGNNIAFPATQVPSAGANVLDDYEEGTFTPTIVGTTSAGVGTYSEQVGRYTKIGNRVFYTINFEWSAHTGTGNMRISGLPFTATSATAAYHTMAFYHSNVAMTAGNTMQGWINVSGTQILMYQVPTGGGASALLPIDTAGTLRITGSYEV